MKRISPQAAQARITERMPNYAPKQGGQAESLTFLRSHGDAVETLYEYKRGKSHIFATAFRELPPIIGTCDVEGDDMPPAMEGWLADYAHELEQLGVSATPIDSDEAEANDGEMVGPLVSCRWNQKAPYNDKIINGCVTGCGATAISMILREFGKRGFHRGCKPVKSYTTKTNKYIVPALKSIISFDYKNMPEGKPKTQQEIAAVATMMQYVGYALQSDYRLSATSASLSKALEVMRDYLQMGSQMKIIYSYNGAKIFESALKAEILAGRPAFLGGWGTDGGHFFVCDGYDPITNFFHINWGWGGSYDGWFALTALNPSKYNFSSTKKAIIGVQPDYVKGDANRDGGVSVSDVMKVQQMILKHEYSPEADVNQDGVVDVVDMMAIVQEIMKGNTL